MKNAETKACRKCRSPNPASNQYCRKCGAPLRVTTTMISAQRRPVMPRVAGFRWSLVPLTAAAMMGLSAVLSAGALALLWVLGAAVPGFGSGSSLADYTGRFWGVSLTLAAVHIAAVGIASGTLSWISRQPRAPESVLAAILVQVLATVLASAVATDAVWIGGALTIPVVLAAYAGGRLAGASFGDFDE